MQQDVERVRAETLAGMKELFGKYMPDDLDLSYITAELIETYEKQSKDKDPKAMKESEEGFPEEDGKVNVKNWCFYGHHLTKKGAWWHWQNGNPNNGCDAPRHTCRPGHFWRFQITQSAPIKCARRARNPAFCGN
tara:strand:- start:487 stop:891 length:405 start_codon:yes stop_codon:yes gene_type:complete